MPATGSASPATTRMARRRPPSSRSTICRRPTTKGKATFPVALDKMPETTRPLEAQITVRMAEAGGRAVERKLTLPVAPTGPMIGVKPLFSGRSLGEGDTADFDVVVAAPDGKPLARSGLRYELLKVESRYQWYRQDGPWNYEPIKSTRRIADGTDRCRGRQARPHRRAGEVGPLPARSLDRRAGRRF